MNFLLFYRLDDKPGFKNFSDYEDVKKFISENGIVKFLDLPPNPLYIESYSCFLVCLGNDGFIVTET